MSSKSITRKSIRAIIKDGEKYLLVQRAAKYSFAGRWEFVGGKADGKGTLQDNMKREVREEVGLRVADMIFIKRIYDPATDAVAFFFYCNKWSGDIKFGDDENQNAGWFTLAEIQDLELTSATKLYVESLGTTELLKEDLVHGD